ncbi:MAG: FAD-dependent oxidoreductase, partial [Bacilli bacterium]|nr:FAD-dependent oxidoreductase [Bacilli bacterium]
MTNINDIKEYSSKCASCITKPCQVGCPLNNDTTGFIKLAKEGKYKEAYKLLSNTTILAPLCGRICPHEKQCQGMCVKKVSYEEVKIGAIESFLGDMALENNWYTEEINVPLKKEKVAIIGGGPAGLTCAYFLRKNGYNVTIYEKHNCLGGLLNHGIPEFRLPKTLLKKVIDNIISTGIEVKLNQELGRDFSLAELEQAYDAIFLGFGANISSKMNIEGEDLNGVYGGNELLENNEHPDYTGKTVIVSGGGNVAMDVSRTVKKLGAEKVYVIYRRSEKEAPAETKEILEAKEEGIEFLFQTNILRILGQDKVEKIECIKT